MEIIRTAYINTIHKYTLTLDDELAADCENYIKHQAVDPETVPHISVQTLAQCWTDEIGYGLAECQILVRGYSTNYSVDLTSLVYEFLNEAIWDSEYDDYNSDIEDYDDDIHCINNEYRELVVADNPDFPDPREVSNAQ